MGILYLVAVGYLCPGVVTQGGVEYRGLAFKPLSSSPVAPPVIAHPTFIESGCTLSWQLWQRGVELMERRPWWVPCRSLDIERGYGISWLLLITSYSQSSGRSSFAYVYSVLTCKTGKKKKSLCSHGNPNGQLPTSNNTPRWAFSPSYLGVCVENQDNEPGSHCQLCPGDPENNPDNGVTNATAKWPSFFWRRDIQHFRFTNKTASGCLERGCRICGIMVLSPLFNLFFKKIEKKEKASEGNLAAAFVTPLINRVILADLTG